MTRIKPGMKPRLIVAAAAALAALGGMLPAHAAGSIFGTGFVNSGCSGGSLLLQATNSGSNNWIWDVTAICSNQFPQHVVIAGSWNATTGGVVTGFGSGSLQVGTVNCGSNSNVSVQIAMTGSPLLNGKATITRSCF